MYCYNSMSSTPFVTHDCTIPIYYNLYMSMSHCERVSMCVCDSKKWCDETQFRGRADNAAFMHIQMRTRTHHSDTTQHRRQKAQNSLLSPARTKGIVCYTFLHKQNVPVQSGALIRWFDTVAMESLA